MQAPRAIRAAAPAALALCVLSPASAGAHPPGQARLPPVWTDPQCMTIVDRSVDPIVAIEYTVLAE